MRDQRAEVTRLKAELARLQDHGSYVKRVEELRTVKAEAAVDREACARTIGALNAEVESYKAAYNAQCLASVDLVTEAVAGVDGLKAELFKARRDGDLAMTQVDMQLRELAGDYDKLQLERDRLKAELAEASADHNHTEAAMELAESERDAARGEVERLRALVNRLCSAIEADGDQSTDRGRGNRDPQASRPRPESSLPHGSEARRLLAVHHGQ